MVRYKLYYFAGRGRGEVIRLIFAQAKVDYEDIRLSYEEWPQHQPTTPLGKLPVLEVDGVKMPQSVAIARYLAKKYNMAGRTDLEMYWVDVFVDEMKDINNKYPALTDDDKKKVELKKHFFEVVVPDGLQKIERLYRQHNNGRDCFLVGEFSVADLTLMTLLDFLLPLKPGIDTGVPGLAGVYKRVRELPNIKAWIDKRPRTHF